MTLSRTLTSAKAADVTEYCYY